MNNSTHVELHFIVAHRHDLPFDASKIVALDH